MTTTTDIRTPVLTNSEPARTPRTRTRRPRPRRDLGVPPGLSAAFSRVEVHESVPESSRRAAQVLPYAVRIIELLQDQYDQPLDGSGGAFETILKEAVEDIYHPETLDTFAALATSTGFEVGYAVCWLLLASVKGRHGGAQ